MTAILVVDDEATIRKVVDAYLSAEGFTVYHAVDGNDGLIKFRQHQPELVVLDIMLPSINGLDVLQQIRRESDVYVLMLTAKTEEMDRVIGLTVGADDYLTKPFSPRELVARVKAILRRGRDSSQNDDEVLHFRHIQIDIQRHEVRKNNNLIELTALDFDLLRTLATHAGMVLDRNRLLELVWGYDYYGDTRVVDVHIGHIRQKIEDDPANPQIIQTVRGVGYKFVDE